MFTRLDKIYHEYPAKFWMVILVSFIGGIGSTLLFPFFSLYVTQKFGIGMTQVGIILGMVSAFGLLGNMVVATVPVKDGHAIMFPNFILGEQHVS